MRRLTETGTEYDDFSEYPLPTFPTLALKEATIQLTKDLYAKGDLIRGQRKGWSSSSDRLMGHCILGVLDRVFAQAKVSYAAADPRRRADDPERRSWFRLMVTNNGGPSNYGHNPEDGSCLPVTPNAFAELMEMLHDCPVGSPNEVVK
jgi:hypothetical protein